MKSFSGKRILITGGLGFIGSNLARALVNGGAEVTLVDSLVPEYGGNLFNIDDIKNHVKVNISDVRDPFSIQYLIRDKEFLFNLAGQTSHLDSMIHPQKDLDINVSAQLSILEACRQFNPDIRIIFASTRQVYGKPKYLPVDEQHSISPVDVNGINKVAGETYHMLYNSIYGIKSTAVRLTNTYGPGMRIKDSRQTFLGIWVRNILENNSIKVFGDGAQLRDFNYVEDCVSALLLLAASENAAGRIYNLGSNEVISLEALARMMIHSGFGGAYELIAFPPERKAIDIGDYYSDFSALSNDYGWKPKVSLDIGLLKTLEYYKKYKNYYIQ
ncbi:NAD-dependent epimerase/dehydratase family protein [Betaproteobacteria bacterium LSUCC0117]|nr:NAD-dependent epimerase/dehydratase family protein [Betaproteobacteria bacterium LSUCC0117]